MKKITALITLSILFTLTSCTSVIDKNKEAVWKDKLVYEINHEEPYTGVIQSRYETGELRTEKNFINGKAHGRLNVWHKNGVLGTILDFNNGERDGIYQSWHDNGQLKLKSNYNKNKLHGTMKVWDVNGKLVKEVYYDNGVKQPKK